jgi:hypothetical protein
MFEKILSHPKTQEIFSEVAKKGIEKTVAWTKEKIDSLDKPVAKDIPSNTTSLRENGNYITELDKPVEIESTFSQEINKHISSPRELELYKNAGLKEGIVNDRPALLKNDINWEQKDEFGLSNRERVQNGNPPLASNGEIIELHHVGQKPDSPLAELTRSEHRGKGNDTILHDKTKESEIDRNVFQKERQAHWQNRIGVEV